MRRIEKLQRFLRDREACSHAKGYVTKNSHLTPRELWNKCENGDHLFWLLQRINYWAFYDRLNDISNRASILYPYSSKKRSKYLAKLIKETFTYSEVSNSFFKD